jgi:dienelactone hydrolase
MPVKGVVSFHGGLGKDSARSTLAVKPKVLVLHGADDPYVSEESIKSFQKEMKDAKADWQMVYYSNAEHAFTDPAAETDGLDGTEYNKDADERSWRAMITFLQEVFGK